MNLGGDSPLSITEYNNTHYFHESPEELPFTQERIAKLDMLLGDHKINTLASTASGKGSLVLSYLKDRSFKDGELVTFWHTPTWLGQAKDPVGYAKEYFKKLDAEHEYHCDNNRYIVHFFDDPFLLTAHKDDALVKLVSSKMVSLSRSRNTMVIYVSNLKRRKAIDTLKEEGMLQILPAKELLKPTLAHVRAILGLKLVNHLGEDAVNKLWEHGNLVSIDRFESEFDYDRRCVDLDFVLSGMRPWDDEFYSLTWD
jgi:hypothetical protein